VKSVFANGAMVEGWAVYTERMMLENGWGNNAPEQWLMFYKWSLRECCNVIIDYGLQGRNLSKEDFENLLVKEAFQEKAQVRRNTTAPRCRRFSSAPILPVIRKSLR
jgi:uncharacterized protein (DUF885 family)